MLYTQLNRVLWIPVVLFLLLLIATPAAAESITPSKGQTIYIPAYSHIYHGPKTQPCLLTTTLSIHNTNLQKPFILEQVKYYDSQGMLVKKLLNTPKNVTSMQTVEFIVPERDTSGGSGANFVVVWSSPEPVNPPLIEAVMIGSSSGLGISFTTRGVNLTR